MKPMIGSYPVTNKLFQGVTVDNNKSSENSSERGEAKLLEEFTQTLDKIAARLNNDLGQDISSWLIAGQQLPSRPELRIVPSHDKNQGLQNKSEEIYSDKESSSARVNDDGENPLKDNYRLTSDSQSDSKDGDRQDRNNSSKENEEAGQVNVVRSDFDKPQIRNGLDNVAKQNENATYNSEYQELVSNNELIQASGSSKDISSQNDLNGNSSELNQLEDEIQVEGDSVSSLENNVKLEGQNTDLNNVDSQTNGIHQGDILTKLKEANIKTTPQEILQQALLLLGQVGSNNLIQNSTNQTTQTIISKSSEASALKQLSGSSSSSQLSNNSSAAWGGPQNIKERSESQRSQNVNTQRVPLKNLERVESALKEAAKARDGRTISLRLDPPDLGSVKVDVTLKDGALHARLSAESSNVTSMLRERSHELQYTLRKLGLNVEKVSVSVGNENAFETVADSGSGSYSQDSRSDGNKNEGGNQSSGFDDLGDASFSIGSGVVKDEKILDHWIA